MKDKEVYEQSDKIVREKKKNSMEARESEKCHRKLAAHHSFRQKRPQTGEVEVSEIELESE